MKSYIFVLVLLTASISGAQMMPRAWQDISTVDMSGYPAHLTVVSADTLYFVDDAVRVFRSTNGGSDWHNVLFCDSCHVDANAGGIQHVSGTGFLVSLVTDNFLTRLFLISENGEVTRIPGDSLLPAFHRLQFFDRLHGFVFGAMQDWPVKSSASFYYTSDGGESWSAIDLPSDSITGPMCFRDTNTGIVGRYRTTDRGLSWDTTNTASTQMFCLSNGTWVGKTVYNAEISTDDGRHWSASGLPGSLLSLMSQVNGNVALGDSSIVFTSNGTDWLTMPALEYYRDHVSFSYYDEIAVVNRLTAYVHFPSPNGSRIWKTTTGGINIVSEVASGRTRTAFEVRGAEGQHITLKFAGPYSRRFVIFDVVGRVMLEGQTRSGERTPSISTEALCPGPYLIRLEGEPKPIGFIVD